MNAIISKENEGEMQMKSMPKCKKVLYAIAIVVAFMFTVCGCAARSMSEEELQAAVQEELYSTIDSDMQIEEFNIDLRKTDTANKTDYAQVSITAENEVASIQRKYSVSLYLYDQGWGVESISGIEESEWTAIPKVEPSQEMINDAVKQEVITDSDFRPEEGLALYCYNKTRECPNWIDYKTMTVLYSFNVESLQWQYDDTMVTDEYKDWLIDGTWEVVETHPVMAGSCVYNSDYKVRADVNVVDNVAYVYIYAYGSTPEYFNINQTYQIELDPTESFYRTEDITFSEKVPGFMPISKTSCFWFDDETVALDNLYVMQRVNP